MKTIIIALLFASLFASLSLTTMADDRFQTITVSGWTFLVDGILTVEEIEIVCLRYKYTGRDDETYKEINNFLKAKTEEQKNKDKMGSDFECYEFINGKVVRTR